MTAAHLSLQAFWREAGGDPAPHAQSEITWQRIERRYQLRLPEDFRAYLNDAAPSEDFWDQRHVIWWSADSIKNIEEEYEHGVKDASIAALASKCLFFADYMIWCWAWAICCDDGEHYGKIVSIGGASDRWIASSFTDFVDNYLRDPLFVVD